MALEDRQLMATGALGIDLASTLGYVNLMQETRAWTPLNAPTLATDASGWPLADAQIVVFDDRVNQSYNGPDSNAVQPDTGGTYHLSFQGQATIKPDYFQNFAVQNQLYNATTNTTTADIVMYGNLDPILMIDFTNTVNPASSSKAGVANVKLIQPGYDPDTTQVFTNTMLTDLKPFSTLRYLNLDGANSYNTLYTNTYQTYTTPSFAVTAGPHLLSFKGLNTTGDATAFLDNVHLVADGNVITSNGAELTSAPPIGDPGFETVQIGSGNFQYNPTGSAWTFAGSSGLAANYSGFTGNNPVAPEGQQVALLQNQGVISQTVANFAAGNYHIDLAAMQRDGYPTAQSFQILVDNKVVATFTPPVGQLTTADWSTRKLPSAASQIAGPGAPGESWEDMIALANATKTDMWINIPGPATNDYITQLANLIKKGDTVNGVMYAGLNPNLKVNLEISNEVWGGNYNNFLYNVTEAQALIAAGDTSLTDDGVTDLYTVAQRYQLERTMQATTIFRGVLGADPTYAKIRPMLGAQETDAGYFAGILPWFEKTFGAPSNYFYGIGGANYSSPSDYSSVDNLIASEYANLPALYNATQQFVTVANYYGLQDIAYEGGVYTAGATTAAGGQVSLAASRDPRMEAFTQQLYNTYYAAGGGLAEVFDGPYDIITPSNQYATAELAQAANPAAAAKYRGLVDVSQTPLPTVTAGIPVSATSATALSVTSDSLANSYLTPTSGNTAYYLLSVATAGQYNLTLQTTSGPPAGQVLVTLGDATKIGTTTVGPNGTFSLGTLTLHAGLNTVALSTLSPYNVSALSLSPLPVLKDTGFEDDLQPSNGRGYIYNPVGTAWTFAGPSGLTLNNTAFTSGNPSTPEGAQVAFLQNQGAISQSLTNATAGTYHITFVAASRGNYGSAQTFQVLIDGKPVGNFTPTSLAYLSFATTAFTLGVGQHNITFQGLNSNGDATDFLDQIQLTPTAAVSSLSDPGFEDDLQPVSGRGYVYNPLGTAWTFAGQSGLSLNNTAFTSGNPSTPDGLQVAFLQNQGSITQTLSSVVAGTYHISFVAAMRANYGSTQSFKVLVDGNLVGSYSPNSPSYVSFVSNTFALAAGQHTISFQGLNSYGDATDFLDQIQLTQTAPVSNFSDSGFEDGLLPASGPGYLYNPVGTAWTFTGQSGLSLNNSGFTSGNPTTPDGLQVAFVENQGSIAQTLTNTIAGTYHITFVAALRGNFGTTQTFQVLVDGKSVGSYTPNSKSYVSFASGTFALGLGQHTVTFQGLNTTGDGTDLLDEVQLVQDSITSAAIVGTPTPTPPGSSPGGFAMVAPVTPTAGILGNPGFTSVDPALVAGQPVVAPPAPADASAASAATPQAQNQSGVALGSGRRRIKITAG